MSGDGIGRLTQMLELNEFKLNSLLEITKGINNNLSIPNILKIYEYILREQLGISKLLLYAYDQKNWKCILHFGAKGLNKKIKVAEELIHIKDITVIESSSIDTLNSFDIIIPIFHKNSLRMLAPICQIKSVSVGSSCIFYKFYVIL